MRKLPRPELRLDGVAVARDRRILLRDIDLTLDGGVVALLGRNGVGKTTLLRAIAGGLTPSAGTIALDGIPIATLAPRQRARRITLVESTEPVLSAVRVADAVAAARFPYHRWFEWEPTPADRLAIDDALARTGLAAYRERELGTLSAGERQRVWIALAIAQQAPVILLDEPTSHLDLAAALETLRLLRELAASGALVVAVLHQLEEAAAFADRVIVLGCERVLADGAPAEALSEDVIARAYDVRVAVERRPDGLAFHRA
jgi:iron complex transport system ATP-binding protein